MNSIRSQPTGLVLLGVEFHMQGHFRLPGLSHQLWSIR